MIAVRSGLLVALLFAVTGCVSSRSPGVGQLACHYRFSDIRRAEDQQRIDAAIRSVALGAVAKTGTSSYPEYRFTVARAADLDQLQPHLLYRQSAGWRIWADRQQTLNVKPPTCEATFESTDIAAAMEIIVTFTIKPGSKLFYHDEGGREVDITPRVDAKGKVTLHTRIAKGQQFIYARALKDNVSRYIKIDVHSQQVGDATAREYGQRWAF
jgi:hypothetical protein